MCLVVFFFISHLSLVFVSHGSGTEAFLSSLSLSLFRGEHETEAFCGLIDCVDFGNTGNWYLYNFCHCFLLFNISGLLSSPAN